MKGLDLQAPALRGARISQPNDGSAPILDRLAELLEAPLLGSALCAGRPVHFTELNRGGTMESRQTRRNRALVAGHDERPPAAWSIYQRALEAVDFHVQALRYRAGLPNTLSAEERQLVRHARRAVEEFLRGRHDGTTDPQADWMETWAQDPSPAFIQAIATELQVRNDVATLGRALSEG
jgi:hypothetical protein